MIRVRNLTKRYGRVAALDNISFDARRGEVLGILGPNGAGKTTLMRVLCSVFPATGGIVEIAGLDVWADSLAVRRRIGYVPENTAIYPEMRVSEYLAYRGALKGLAGRRLRSRIDEVTARCGLEPVRNMPAQRMSKGYLRRVALADGLLHEPDVLVLDEPVGGLDPIQVRRMRSVIRDFAECRTVLLSSHFLHEVEELCDRVLIMDRGKIVLTDTPVRLRGMSAGGMRVVLEVRGPRDDVRRHLERIDGVKSVAVEKTMEDGWECFCCECEKETDARSRLAAAIVSAAWPLRELKMKENRLEDVFIAVMGGSERE